MNIPAPFYLLFCESQHRPTGGRWRFMLQALADGHCLEAEASEPPLPNKRLQLLAVVRGLEALDQPAQVTLVTSSRYVHRGLRFGLPEWRTQGWRWEHFGRLEAVPHADLWQRVDRALSFHQITCRRWLYAADPDWRSDSAPRQATPKAADRWAGDTPKQAGKSSPWRGLSAVGRRARAGVLRWTPGAASVAACLTFSS